jgi:electron transfer flavoprotein beta subunit
MKILVAIKQVPVRDSLLNVAASGAWIEDAALSYEINEPDAYALEAALQLRERQGGEVVALCAGPDRVGSTIREALAKGADRAIHVVVERPEACDAFIIAALLAAAAVTESPDLILTGLQSDDLGSGQTGVIMAELLNLPHATLVMSIEVDAGRVTVKRELEGGWFQRVSMPLPALLTVQSGISKLRYATLMGIKKARTKEVRQMSNSLPAAGVTMVPLTRIYPPRHEKQTQMLAGTPAEQAAQLVEKLQHEVRAI